MTPYLAAAIAFLGVCIAWGQWYTARQKLVLDLFEKRYDRYQRLRRLLLDFHFNDPKMSDADSLIYLQADMKPLFGDDVMDAIRNYEEVIKKDRSGDAFRDERMARVVELHKLVQPYLRMDQRLPRTPWRWVKDRWHNRPNGSE